MRIPHEKKQPIAVASARWWRNTALDIGLRLVGLIVLVVGLASGSAEGGYLWFGVAAAVVMTLLLVLPIVVCVTALRRHGWADSDSQPARRK